MTKKIITLLLVFILIFTLAACNKTNNDSSTSGGGSSEQSSGSSPTGDSSSSVNSSSSGGSSSSEGSPSSGGSTAGGSSSSGDTSTKKPVEIIAAFNSIPNGLDPISEDVSVNLSISLDVYDRLIWLDGDGNWLPNAALSWWQVDELNYEFEIDLNLVFQNGDPLTMEDVVFSITRLKDIPKGAEIGTLIDEVTYEGNILRMKITQPDNSIVAKLNTQVVIVNKTYIEENGDDAIYLKPISTGPYKVTEFVPGTRVVIETWDGYAYEKPQIDKITYIPIPENSTRYIAVETGQAQFAALVSDLEVSLAEGNSDLSVLRKTDTSRNPCFAFNCESSLFSNVNVRRALVHAMDLDSMCALMGGRTQNKMMLFAGYPDFYYIPAGFPEYNLEKAKEMLAAEGYSESNPLKFTLTYWVMDPAVELYQSMLSSIGVEMELDFVEFSVYLTREGSGDFDMIFTTQTNRGTHPLTDLDRFNANLIGSRDLSRFYNARVQEIIPIMLSTTDQQELQNLAREISTIIGEEVPMVGVFLTPAISIMDKGLSGVLIRRDLWSTFRHATYIG